ncbi:MAG: lysophospholipid acyltransferase family protein [Burkholderiales bacterium]|nr:lysophospholipid acyltransferase family protein [Burkholderiales bacterium]
MLNKFLISLGIWVLRLISLLPMPLTRALGTVMGLIAYALMSKRRHIGMVNLNLCFPEKSLAEKQRILRQHFAELFIIGLDYGLLFGASKFRMRRLIKYRGFANFEKYYKQRPIVLLAPHFIGLDIGGNRTTMDISGYTMFSEQRNQYLSERVKQARTRFMIHNGGEIFSRKDGLRTIVKKMKQNKLPFYYLPDQDMDEKSSVYVPFFAHPNCATLDTLPKILKLADAVVIPMATYREGNRYVIEFGPAWENYPSGDVHADVAFMNRQIEAMIIKHPSQYLWIHKRFKTQPDLPRGKLYKSC